MAVIPEMGRFNWDDVSVVLSFLYLKGFRRTNTFHLLLDVWDKEVLRIWEDNLPFSNFLI